MSFLKRLFGSGEKQIPPTAAPIPEAAPDSRAEVQRARDAARLIRRQREPLKWAEAQQNLANALIALAAAQSGGAARSSLEEAETCLSDALEAADLPGTHPAFLASLTNLCGYAGWQRAHLLDGDEKGRTLAEAANRFTDALARLTPETNRDLWTTLGFYRGAVFHELALLRDGPESLAWFDEAAAAFKLVEDQSMTSGERHPIAAYNRYVVLEARAQRSPAPAARAYFTAAREPLVFAMTSPSFEAAREEHQSRLAALDAALAVS